MDGFFDARSLSSAAKDVIVLSLVDSVLDRSKNKKRLLQGIAREIAACSACKKGCTGLPVPGEGSAEARIVFVGEAPGKEEAKTGRPFVGRSGKLLRQAIRDMGLEEASVFITSPVHYLPRRGTPSREMVVHGREHLFQQLSVIDPAVIVLLGNTACLALLDRTVKITKEHGTTVQRDGRTAFITVHPAYAVRFAKGKALFLDDLATLKRLLG